MILFFDGVSSTWYIALYSPERNLVASETFHIAGNESTQTVGLIDSFLQKQGITYPDVDQIVCVIGPGSFTGVRTISLVINTLAFIYPHISLTGVSFFDLYDSYPIIKSSSKRDLFVKYEKSATIQIEANKSFEESFEGSTIYGDTDISRFEREYILVSQIDYDDCLQSMQFENKKRLAPLYIKKPNIS